MALPVAPPPKSNDVAVLGWAGLTVRIAWTLLGCGVKVGPDVLRDARTHVLYHLDPGLQLPLAEDLATRMTEEFVARARGQLPADPWPGDWEMPLTPRWRKAVERAADGASAVVFAKHHGDHRSLAWLEGHLQLDRVAVDALLHGLREIVRGMAVADGLPVEGWPPERMDRLLRRLAGYAPGPCPPVLDVAEGCHRDHVAACPRCARTVRLLQAGLFTVDDLFAPTISARPTARTRVLALHLHPDARRARRRLVDELPAAIPLGDDLILVDGAQIHAATRALVTAAEVGSPAREHVRGLVLEGPGTFTPRGLLGPLAERAVREVLGRSWGVVDGVGELPPVLPNPPSARRWWAATWAIGAVGVGLAALALRVPTPPAEVEVAFTAARGGTWAAFDVPERALVTVVGLHDGQLEPVLRSATAADKAALATGDGSYRVHVPGDGVLLAVTAEPVELPALIAAAAGDPAPLDALAGALSTRGEVHWTGGAGDTPPRTAGLR